jgi:4-hydroxysphinganine ceramide fatty acyl 2-hydroxylase
MQLQLRIHRLSQKNTFMSYLLFLISGIISWTFLEYCIHRFLGHLRKKNPVSTEHLMHHSKGNYFAPMYKKIIAAIIVISGLTLLLSVFFNTLSAFMYAFGLGGMYMMYESVHFMFHKIPPITYWGRVLRKHHFYHHYKNPNKNFGVTNRFWDRIFRTYYRATDAQLRVPVRVATPWIIQHHQSQKINRDYQLMQ